MLGKLSGGGCFEQVMEQIGLKRLEENTWWPELVLKKDSMSLRELAKEFGSTAGSINKALKRNGLERQHAPSGPRTTRSAVDEATAPKTAKKAAPKKAAPKKAAAKKAAPTKAAPTKVAPAKAAPKRVGAKPGPKGLRASTVAKLAPYISMLGDVADGEIASMAGISIQTVARVRKERGIAPRRGRGMTKTVVASDAPRRRPGRPSKIAPFEDKLAAHSDADVAAMAGVSENAVRNYRKRNGLAAAVAPAAVRTAPAAVRAAPAAVRTAPKIAKAAPKAAVPAVIMVGQRAYRVNLDGRTAIVVGTNLVEAARKAVESGSEVTSIELLGDILA